MFLPAVVTKAEESKDLPTRKNLEILLRLEENKVVEQQKVKRPMPVGKYSVVYADPPWRYDFDVKSRATENHYPTLALPDIIKYRDNQGTPITDKFADNCILSQFSVVENWDTRQGIRDYLSGMSLREVAEKHHVGKSTLERVLREYHQRKDLISEHCRNRGHLKSVVQYSDRGPWGDTKFPGNTSGYLLVDLIDYYQPESILDPMEGSGTTSDVNSIVVFLRKGAFLSIY